MKRQLESLTGTLFDLAVIGGGIQGAAVAREAALRGLKVALVESRDFGSGTSSRSSKLIHGGLRYLQQYDFKLVREARSERRLLAKLAPHLARPIPFLVPVYRNDPYSPLKLRVGLTIYDFLGNLGRDDRHRMYRSRAARSIIPGLRRDDLRGAAVYYDSQTDDARLTLENVLDAAQHAAIVCNHAEVRSLVRTGTTDGGAHKSIVAEIQDRLTGRKYELAARLWVNAAGPWVDEVRSLVPGYDGSKTVRLTKGIHVIVPPVTGRYAVLAAIPPGDRVFLLVPWHNAAMLGTTDTDFEGDPECVDPDRSDSEYLLEAVNRVLQRPLRLEDVAGAWAGVRALALQPGHNPANPSAMTREYRFHEDPWAPDFISICGGKLTTARLLAENLVNVAAGRLGYSDAKKNRRAKPGAGRSRVTPLPGGHTGPFEVYVNYAAWEAVRLFDVPYAIAERIVRTYGSRWRDVLRRIPENKSLAQPLSGRVSLLPAEVEFSIEEEMALTVEDFLLRRSGLSWTACMQGDAVSGIANIFARCLGWSSEQRDSAIASFASKAGC